MFCEARVGRVRYVCRKAVLNRLRLPKPAAKAISVIGRLSFIQKTLSKLKTSDLRKRDGRRSHVLQKQATQMASSQSQHTRQVIDRSVIENALIDQAQRPAYNGRGP